MNAARSTVRINGIAAVRPVGVLKWDNFRVAERVGIFNHHVIGIGQHKGVVTQSANHGRQPGTAHQRCIAVARDQGVVAGIAGNDVIEVVAG